MIAAPHGMCVQARHEPCSYCPAAPEQYCDGHCVHLCRICLATQHGAITYRETGALMRRLGVFAGWTLILDAVS
jgi:hypothetical protein